jgi:hypothetical protein
VRLANDLPGPRFFLRVRTIFWLHNRLHVWMNAVAIVMIGEQDRQISGAVEQQRLRLRNYIRRRVPDPSDAA